MSDCTFAITSGRWHCPACDYTYPRQSDKPPRRNCPAAPGQPTLAESLLTSLSLAREWGDDDEDTAAWQAVVARLDHCRYRCAEWDGRRGCRRHCFGCRGYSRLVKLLLAGDCAEWLAAGADGR
jgi:hypothetical protein